MKHNLKTFPKKFQAQGTEYFTPDIEVWLRNFTEELQQLKQDYDKTFHCLIDEVLGDIPHVGSNPTTKGENQQ